MPAGTFKAIPVAWKVTRVGDGEPLTPTVVTFWFAADIGLVKVQHQGGEKVLKSFTTSAQAKK